MVDRVMPNRRPGLVEVLGETARSTRELFQRELDLLKAETSEGLRRALVGLAVIVAGAVFAVVSISLVVEAIVEWLAVVLGSEVLAAAIGAAATALIALVAILYGARLISSISAVPSRTFRSVKRDAETVAESVT